MTLVLRQSLSPGDAPATGSGVPVHAPGHVVIDRISKRFTTRDGTVFQALDDVSIDIPPGTIFGIIGRSGAGKSTLIRTINQLERPTSGRVLVGGQDVAALARPEIAQVRRRIGMIFQHFNLLSAKTVAGNIALPLKIAGVPADRIKARVRELLDLVGLADKHDVYPAKLSGGQKQRVGIARALVHNPDILLCDEATSALDPETTQSILALLKDINQRLKPTIILITHEMSVIREICDRVAVLEQGRVVETGPVWQVFGARQAAATRALLQSQVHELPDAIRRRLSPGPVPGGQTLLRLAFDGHGNLPDLAALGAAAGLGLRIVAGGIDNIQGHAQGALIVALDSGALQADPAAIERLASLATSIEVLGHVGRPD